MRAVLQSSGRGRPLNLTVGPITSRTLLQLELLLIEKTCRWEKIHELYGRLHAPDNDPLQGISLRSQIEALVNKGEQLKDVENLNIFLSMDIATSVAEHNVGTYLRENKIFRQHLLNPEQLKSLPNKPQITNGLILDLIHFFQTHTTSWITNIKPVLDNLGLNTSKFSEKQLTSRWRSCMERHKSLKKSIKRPNGQKKHWTVFIQLLYANPYHVI